MNKEEIEELKDFTIDLTDIDELALGLEVCSKKSNMVIQEFADTIIQLQQENKQLKEELKYTVPIVEHNKIVSKKLKENQKYKEVIDKAINDLNIIIDIVREKPLGSDCWIIDRLEANKSILKEVE